MMANADRFAAALAEWAVALEMPAPRRTAQGSSGGYHYEIDGHGYFLGRGDRLEDELDAWRQVWRRHRVAELAEARGYPREVAELAWARLGADG